MSEYFGPIMVIGSILAAIFASGAIWNSIVRRRLLRAHLIEEEAEQMTFSPPPTVPMALPTPIAPPTPAPEEPARPAPVTSLFRQIGPTGDIPESSIQDKEELYVWE